MHPGRQSKCVPQLQQSATQRLQAVVVGHKHNTQPPCGVQPVRYPQTCRNIPLETQPSRQTLHTTNRTNTTHFQWRGTIVHRIYGIHKNLPWYIFTYLYRQYLVKFTMVPRDNDLSRTAASRVKDVAGTTCTCFCFFLPPPNPVASANHAALPQAPQGRKTPPRCILELPMARRTYRVSLDH